MLLFANCGSQLLLDRLGRCIKLFVSSECTSSHEFVSQFGLAICFYAKNTQNALKPCRLRECLFKWTSDRQRKGAVTSPRLVASDIPNSDNLKGDNCGYSGDRLSQNGEKATSQNGDNDGLYIHGLNNLAYASFRSPCVCSV